MASLLLRGTSRVTGGEVGTPAWHSRPRPAAVARAPIADGLPRYTGNEADFAGIPDLALRPIPRPEVA